MRRGLVKLDPEPKLHNASFAAFVRQAERPDAIAKYKSEAPRSVWDRVGRLVTIAVPLATVAIAMLAWLAGVGVDKLAPLLVGIVPALFTSPGARRTG